MKIISPWIQVTNNCNLKCSYCHIKQKNDSMKEKTHKNICEKVTKLIAEKKINSCILRLAGGEPLLKFDLIKKIYEKYLSNKFKISFITNLTNIPDGFIDFVQKFDINVGVSYDGKKERKYHNNKIAGKDTLKNIKKLRYCYLTILTTITKTNYNKLKEIAKLIIKYNFEWQIQLPYEYDGFYQDKIIKNILVIIDYLKKNKYNLDKFHWERLRIEKSEKSCVKENGKMWAIETDGNIFPCQSFLGKKMIHITSVNDKNFFENLLNQKLYKHGKEYCKNEICNNCKIEEYCQYDCPVHEERKKFICKINKYVTLKLLKYKMEEL